MQLRTLKDCKPKGKRVLLRVDLNVPIDHGQVRNDARIRAVVPTIKKILSLGARQVVLMSHLGRPEGKRNMKYSLGPVRERLSKLLGKKVEMTKDCVGVKLPNGKIILLENLRFHPEEEKNDKAFARKLADYGDIYVNDAFATMHRAHASVEAVARLLPGYAGLLVEKEVKMLGKCLERPKRPFLAIIGGGKADKIGLLRKISKKADKVAVLGVLGNILLGARGDYHGKVKASASEKREAKKLCKNKKILLPLDGVCATEPDGGIRIRFIWDVPPEEAIFDAGPKTLMEVHGLIKRAKTVLFAGTPGLYEDPHFSCGTRLIAGWMAQSKAITVTAGGDTAAAVSQAGVEKKMSHVSTGGGAAVAFVEGERLPGLIPLMKK